MDAAPIPPTSLGYAARFASTAPENRRSGENATKKSRSATRPDARSSAGANRRRVSPMGSVVSKITVLPAWTPGAIEATAGSM